MMNGCSVVGNFESTIHELTFLNPNHGNEKSDSSDFGFKIYHSLVSHSFFVQKLTRIQEELRQRSEH